MDQKIIIAFDPGRTTGVALVNYLGDRNFEIISIYDLAWENRFEIYWTLQQYQTSIIALVIEEFRLFNNPTTIQSQINSEFPSVRVIEDVFLSAYIFDLQSKIVMQKPSDIHHEGKAVFGIMLL